MTPTEQDKELREKIDASMDGQFKSAVLAAANGDTASMGFYVDIAKKNMLQLIATHDQQLLEAILAGAVYGMTSYTDTRQADVARGGFHYSKKHYTEDDPRHPRNAGLKGGRISKRGKRINE